MCFIILTFFIAGPIIAAFNANDFIIPAHGGTWAACSGAAPASNGGVSAASNGRATAAYRGVSGDACGGATHGGAAAVAARNGAAAARGNILSYIMN